VTEDNELDPEEGFHKKWETLLAELDISSIPVNYLKEVNIIMSDGSIENFNIKDLTDKGLSVDEIEELMEDFMDQFDDNIDSLDFHLNLEAIANEVDEKTKKLLG